MGSLSVWVLPRTPPWCRGLWEKGRGSPHLSLSFLCAVPTPEEMSNLTPESSPE